MERLTLILILGSFFGSLQAKEFKVEDVIHPIVAKLPAPPMIKGFDVGFMAISSSSDLAAMHVVQGMTRLNTSWDFEAYRHFCEAAKLDPDCLMAYWGIMMSLAASEHEYFSQRQKSVERMLDLLEWEKEHKVEKWTQLERGYAQAAGRLMTGGPRAAGEAFAVISEQFPNDIQSKLFSQFLLRDGFDDLGNPRVGQRKANDALLEILQANPDYVSVMSFCATSQTEGPLNGPKVKTDVLPIARKLVRLYPDYPPFYLVEAHVEAHCGQAAFAILAAEKAVELYEKYMVEQKVSVFDCEGWVRAKIYLVNLYETKGNHAKALEIAAELAAVRIEKDRVYSRAAGLLLWEGRTAGARIMMGRSDQKSFRDGQAMLEVLSEDQWFKDQSLALFYRDCLAFYLGTRIALSEKKKTVATALFADFVARSRALDSRREIASKMSAFSSWRRATNTLGMGVAELKGMLAELEPEPTKSTCVNWYRAASERQYKSANLMPPTIDYPMQLRLGDFYLKKGEAEKAGRAYAEGLKLRVNHVETLRGYREALLKLGKSEAAAKMAIRIQAVAN